MIEYLSFGGYPRVALDSQLAEKTKLIGEIYGSYLERDAAYLLRVEKTDSFSSLIKLLAGQLGGMVTYSKIASDLNISVATVKKYLWYLEKTFIIKSVTPFYRNTRKELTKSPVVYFNDLGLRNYALGGFGSSIPADGFLFQNLIYLLLKEKLRFQPSRIHYWRTKDKAEVDFVVEMGLQTLPIEVKFKHLKRSTPERSLRNFIKRYNPSVAWIVNLSRKETFMLDNCRIEIFPFYDLIFRPLAHNNR